MKSVSEQQLMECLDLMEQGIPLADILTRYPAQSDVLQPYLETTAHLAQLAMNPTVAQKLNSQNAFLAQATSLKAGKATQAGGWFWLRRALFSLAAVSLFLIIFGAGLITASASALPGDGLYDIKREFEGIQLQMASSSDDKLEIIDQFNAERIREVAALLYAGRRAEVEFDGELELLTADAWVVAQIRAEITEDTIIAGTPQIGSLVRVIGLIENGRLSATHIQVLTVKPTDLVIPEVEPTETLQPTKTIVPTPTNMPSSTPLATKTAVPTPTSTSTATPTETPEATHTPTAVSPTALPDDDDSDYSDDTGDDSEDSEDSEDTEDSKDTEDSEDSDKSKVE